jgi:GntR family carbon starvation induced transcriptional regulator
MVGAREERNNGAATPSVSTPGEVAYTRLRSAIVACEYTPDDRLRVEALSARLGVSSSPLREALNRLAVEGFVVALDQRGFRVAPITVDGIRDLTRLRLLVELEALSEAVRHGDESWEGASVASAHQLAKVERGLSEAPSPVDDRWAVCHRAFHLALYSGCGSPLLMQYSTTLFDLADRYRRFSAVNRARPRAKRTEHRQILDAALERDADLAVVLLRRHIEATARNVTDALNRAAPARAGREGEVA